MNASGFNRHREDNKVDRKEVKKVSTRAYKDNDKRINKNTSRDIPCAQADLAQFSLQGDTIIEETTS